MRHHLDPYLVLGVSSTATQAEIAHAYRARLRDHHPDTRPAPSSRVADDRLQQILAAYALLRDPARRAGYDEATAELAARHQRRPTEEPRSVGAVEIPVTHRNTDTAAGRVSTSPLRAGPVRRHW